MPLPLLCHADVCRGERWRPSCVFIPHKLDASPCGGGMPRDEEERDSISGVVLPRKELPRQTERTRRHDRAGSRLTAIVWAIGLGVALADTSTIDSATVSLYWDGSLRRGFQLSGSETQLNGECHGRPGAFSRLERTRTSVTPFDQLNPTIFFRDGERNDLLLRLGARQNTFTHRQGVPRCARTGRSAAFRRHSRCRVASPVTPIRR